MNYRTGIIIFNIAIPLVILVVVTLVTANFKGGLKRTFDERSQAFKQSTLLNEEIEKVSAATETYKSDYASSWSKLFEGEVSTQVTKTLNKIMAEISSDDLQQTSFRVSDKKSRFTAGMKYPSTSLELSFRGKYSHMQLAIAEFETQLPHFQLEALRVQPPTDGSSHLDFQLNYIVWKK